MKLNRSVASAAGVLTIGALTLTACGSETATESSDSENAVTIEGASTVSGEGATSQQNAMEAFRVAWEAQGGALNYNATGSGSGVKNFTAGQVDFAGSDSALKDDEITAANERCGGNAAWHLPAVIGPVALAYNVDGVDGLVLTPAVAAEIFSGKITKWNDAKIAELNSGATLPDQNITVVFRSDESGTTDNFQKFLTAAGGDAWNGASGKTFGGGIGQGANGSSGVAGEVKNIAGSITYVEAGFADQNSLKKAQIDFGSGPVELNNESAGAALNAIDFVGASEEDLVVDSKVLYALNAPGAYPLVLTTYEIVCSAGYDGETGTQVKNFLKVVLGQGQDSLADAGYVPLPDEYKERLLKTVDALEG